MPDVAGQKLDTAKSAIEDAGYGDEVKVNGGGLFGVVVESNWTVCEQTPSAGATVAGQPILTVARSCADNASSGEPETTATETAPATTEETAPSGPPTATTLTRQNNRELAAILVEDDYCDYKNVAFAKKYTGRTIAFNGSVAAATLHGNYETRWDILIEPGDKGPNTTKGPAFQFRNVNMFDLNREDGALYVNEGEKFRFIAEVGEYNPDQCLFFLNPVKTIPR